MKAKDVNNLPETANVNENDSVLMTRGSEMFRVLMDQLRKFIAYSAGADAIGVPAPSISNAGKTPTVSSSGLGYEMKAINSRELLWNNPRPDLYFEAQDVAVDLSGFKMVMVSFCETNTLRDNRKSVIIPVDGMTYQFKMDIPKANYYLEYIRYVTATAGGIKISDGHQNWYYTSGELSSASNGGYAIPEYIYGIR